MKYFNNKRAFTLAEVLITLGIIGIVAAMTMPSLITKYRHKALEAQFKKAYSSVLQATYPLQVDNNACEAARMDDIRNLVFSQLNLVEQRKPYGYEFKTYNKIPTNIRIHANCLIGGATLATTPDGGVIGFCTNNSYGNMISVDTNGYNKGPNAYGHDLFFFHINLNSCKLEPMKAQWRDCTDDDEDCVGTSDNYNGWKWTDGVCSKDSNATDNGFACTQYAIANTCPDGSGKSYWDCLP